MATVSFTVSDADAERMEQEAVFLDVFGNVRWESDSSLVPTKRGWGISWDRCRCGAPVSDNEMGLCEEHFNGN